ncbi:MAG: hypothetical protein NVS4B11_23170 [Ktedonobacteraceae bacterium]
MRRIISSLKMKEMILVSNAIARGHTDRNTSANVLDLALTDVDKPPMSGNGRSLKRLRDLVHVPIPPNEHSRESPHCYEAH